MAQKLVSLKVKCPHCGKSMMDHACFLNNKPSIKVRIEANGQQGILNLCSSYGCYDKTCTLDLTEGEVVKLSCLACKNDLQGKTLCEDCGAPIVTFDLDKGGKVHICSRVGCKNHFVSFDDIYATLTQFYHDYGYGAADQNF